MTTFDIERRIAQLEAERAALVQAIVDQTNAAYTYTDWDFGPDANHAALSYAGPLQEAA